MIRCTSVSLLKSRIIHLILVFKKEETEGEKSFTLGDTALVNSAEPGLRSGFSPEDLAEPGHCLVIVP